jgi:hypothetical protein
MFAQVALAELIYSVPDESMRITAVTDSAILSPITADNAPIIMLTMHTAGIVNWNNYVFIALIIKLLSYYR